VEGKPPTKAGGINQRRWTVLIFVPLETVLLTTDTDERSVMFLRSTPKGRANVSFVAGCYFSLVSKGFFCLDMDDVLRHQCTALQDLFIGPSE